MLLESPVDRMPLWLSECGPRPEEVILCHCTLARNLADFPFPARCTADERIQIERRILSVLDSLNLLAGGAYYPIAGLTPKEARFLVERRLIIPQMLLAGEARGVYVAEDQRFSIMINGPDHLCLRAQTSGLQPQEAWARLNLMDDTLTGLLDFAFDRRLGYLTSGLAYTGTGLKVGILLHLPCLRELDRVEAAAGRVRNQRFGLFGVKAGFDEPTRVRRASRSTTSEVRHSRSPLQESLCSNMDGAVSGHIREGLGDLFLLVNESSLGIAEEEIVFHIRHLAEELIEDEGAARHVLMHDRPAQMEDRVGRARGVAAGARLLSFGEGLDLLSSIRLGLAAGLVHEHPVQELNELLLRSQRAHLELAAGHECDELALTVERANLFRSRFDV